LLHGNRITWMLRPARLPDTRLYFDLFKLRIGVTIGVTALAGLAISAGPAPAAWQVCALLLAETLAASAAGGFNQMAERDLDRRMRRTSQRAFVTGRLRAGRGWLAALLGVGAAGVALAAAAVNPMAGVYTFLGAFTYGVVYTKWLKRRTSWNIVIGGLAGSFAVLAGGAAVSPHVLQPMNLLLALVLFLWTPPHFWSLAIAYREDYAAAGVPMLPVVVGEERAARIVLASAVVLALVALLPAFFGMGPIYLAAALGGGAYLLGKSARLARRPGRTAAMANFRASLVYLGLLLGAVLAESLLRT
jgi:protoheme IX farnesyltransferase